MSVLTWLGSTRARRGVAASAIVLAAGGLILVRTPATARGNVTHVIAAAGGANASVFQGAGAHGQIGLSQTKVLAGAQSMFAEVRITADDAETSKERAPLAIAVVLDTSGSMSGEKLAQAKSSVIAMLREMHDGDEVAFVRYSSDAQLVQPLSRLGDVRGLLIDKIEALQADGGTNIPSGLASGLKALDESSHGRVRRVVLVSDGLDSTRAEAERLAANSFEHGVTISSMGIGLDFDESYMGGLARAGHGNFGFVNDATALATFLKREIDETAGTTIENATVRVKLPTGVRFVRASGADARVLGSGELELKMGSLFAGDERRAIVELASSLDSGETARIEGRASWTRVGGETADVTIPRLDVVAVNDATEVDRGRDGNVFASATSAFASQRELEATEAYAHGDTDKARRLIDQNIAALATAAAIAPAPAASSLAKQQGAYESQKADFAAAAPSSGAGKRAAKAAAEKDNSNLGRKGF